MPTMRVIRRVPIMSDAPTLRVLTQGSRGHPLKLDLTLPGLVSASAEVDSSQEGTREPLGANHR